MKHSGVHARWPSTGAFPRSWKHRRQRLKSQMEWYHKLAAQYPNWSVVNQYADDGVTGTVKEVRRAFMKMLCDAKEGKFDLIVTREVSRFAAIP